MIFFYLKGVRIAVLQKAKQTNMLDKNLHAGHRERLRAQFRKGGFEILNEHQILELMLSFVVPQKDTNPLAHTLINKFGSLKNVLSAPYESLTSIKGVGHVLAEFFNFENKLVSYLSFERQSYDKIYLSNTTQIISFFKKQIKVEDSEKFFYIYLTARGKLLKLGEFGSGNDSRVNINKKEFLNDIINHGASAVVVCHTHPSGLPTPSWQDKEFTRTLYATLKIINVRLLDHIIISHEGYYSFFQNKLM